MIRRYVLTENKLSIILGRRKAANRIHETAKTLGEHKRVQDDKLLCGKCGDELTEGRKIVSKGATGAIKARYYCCPCARLIKLI